MKQDKQFKSLIDLQIAFPNERECHQYLAAQRWFDGVIECPHCSHDRAYVYKDGIRYKCCECKLVFTAKTDTFMEASKLPTIKWIFAIYLFLHKKGISSIQLSKDIGVTQKTAWFVLQRLRLALGNEKHEEKLSGVVEIDESFVGGKSKFKHKNKRLKYNPGRSWKDKTPVFGMLQRSTGKIRCVVMPDVNMLTIKNAVAANVAKNTLICGDGFTGYRGLQKDYTVENCDHARGYYVNGDIHTNTIEGFWSQFKKGITGIYHKTTPKHLNGYVQEFAFRYNYRHLDAQGQINRVIDNMVCRLKYKDLIAA